MASSFTPQGLEALHALVTAITEWKRLYRRGDLFPATQHLIGMSGEVVQETYLAELNRLVMEESGGQMVVRRVEQHLIPEIGARMGPTLWVAVCSPDTPEGVLTVLPTSARLCAVSNYALTTMPPN